MAGLRLVRYLARFGRAGSERLAEFRVDRERPYCQDAEQDVLRNTAPLHRAGQDFRNRCADGRVDCGDLVQVQIDPPLRLAHHTRQRSSAPTKSALLFDIQLRRRLDGIDAARFCRCRASWRVVVQQNRGKPLFRTLYPAVDDRFPDRADRPVGIGCARAASSFPERSRQLVCACPKRRTRIADRSQTVDKPRAIHAGGGDGKKYWPGWFASAKGGGETRIGNAGLLRQRVRILSRADRDPQAGEECLLPITTRRAHSNSWCPRMQISRAPNLTRCRTWSAGDVKRPIHAELPPAQTHALAELEQVLQNTGSDQGRPRDSQLCRSAWRLPNRCEDRISLARSRDYDIRRKFRLRECPRLQLAGSIRGQAGRGAFRASEFGRNTPTPVE